MKKRMKASEFLTLTLKTVCEQTDAKHDVFTDPVLK